MTDEGRLDWRQSASVGEISRKSERTLQGFLQRRESALEEMETWAGKQEQLAQEVSAARSSRERTSSPILTRDSRGFLDAQRCSERNPRIINQDPIVLVQGRLVLLRK